MTDPISIAAYHDRIAALAPALRERAGEAERLRRLSQQTINELDAAGLLRVFQPAGYGGPELSMAEVLPMLVRTARACPATSWVMAVLQIHIWLNGLFPQQAQDEVFKDDERALVCGVLQPRAMAKRVAGGYELAEATWPYASGCDFAQWAHVGGLLHKDGGPPEVTVFLLPESEYDIIDDWHVVGLRGKQVWSVQTTPSDRRYTITGAPRIVNGRVLIGNGGAEFDARGFVTAYDAATGEQVWRFYTVPGDPALPFENPILEQAVETWNGEWWKYGGGGTAWDAISYDPELNLVYIGVGNGTAFGIESGIVAKWAGVRALNRIVAYTLDGADELPPLPPLPEPPAPPAHTADAETVALGKLLYHQYCTRCHGDAGISAGVIPDLRYMDTATHDLWDAIVLGGARLAKGMPGFSEHLEKAETDAIHAYVIKRAHDLEYIPVRKSSVLTD